MTNRKKNDELSFEAALAELEGIVSKMEQGDLPLEEALQQFERGIQLTKISQAKLQQAQQKVQVLMEQQGQADLVPFDSDQE
ncbi:exodeoxyribonuclease VII small subunit [Aliiglaciecola sp. CAU 1673]|uniref:exodeoxyribonuclease VII small subunit n=1 Tax=Aliiglaciecola sp. CAU 1673 TaxID=3032595 RepID=UPI0023DAC67F|nr:exodeoxyribonuclease VII small subunit [Aliiglaciecola sp. CAU 1673]MDF2178026.1 exodeoxyribonuclease VII small subunit [Aliiglaciecola sp. CAU 1673]